MSYAKFTQFFYSYICFSFIPCEVFATTVTNNMIETFLQVSSARQEILSENIANSSKPKFKVKEVDLPKTYSDLAKISGTQSQIGMKVTNRLHLAGSKPSRRFKIKLDKNAKNFKPNGNNVDLPEQLSKASTNHLTYDQALKAFQISNSLISSALGSGR